MTAKAALCIALLEGRVLNVKNVFKTIGLTNAGREIRRMVEIPFSVQVSRTHRKGKNKYQEDIIWIDYRLNKSEHNQEGIKKMIEYCEKNSRKKDTSEPNKPKTKQLDLL
jgi:hypothetical protein